MTNLEYYKDEINKIMKACNSPSISKKIGYAFEVFSKKYCLNYPHKETKFIDWLLAEHKDPIKLTKFEYDLLQCYQETKDDG